MDVTEYRSASYRVYLALQAAIDGLTEYEKRQIKEAAKGNDTLWALSLLAFSWLMSESRTRIDDPIQEDSKNVVGMLAFLDTESLKRAVARAANASDEVATAGAAVLVAAALRDLKVSRIAALIDNNIFRKLAASLLARHPMPAAVQYSTPATRASSAPTATRITRETLLAVGWTPAQAQELMRGPKKA